MKGIFSAFFASLALLLLGGCDRVATKGAGGSQDSRGDGAPGSVQGNGVRTALIIGNGKYKKLPQLDACPRDAEQMAAAFRKIGVRIHGGKPLVNLTANEMDAALNEFAHSLDRGSEAYIYYSGHGTQIGGGNYLLPVDFDARFESQAQRQAISLDSILALLEGTQSSLRVVILDACRDPGNFLPGESALKGAYGKGLAEQKVDAPETLVCFATKHGTPALADDTASFYTRALAEEIVKPGRVEDVLKAVARRVYAETDKRQLPFMYGSLLQDHFFAGAPPVSAVTPTPASDPALAARIKELEKRLAAKKAKKAAPATPVAAPAVEMAKLAPARPAVATLAAASGTAAHGAGDFVILGEGNAYWTNNLNAPVCKELTRLQKDYGRFHSVAFTPTGDWVALVEGSAFYTSQPNLPACKKLAELEKGTEIQCAAIGPTGGWTVLWSQNGNWTQGVPEDAFNQMQDVVKGGATLRSIAFGPNDAWVLLYDQIGVRSGHIPEDLRKVLDNAVKERLTVRCVCFTTTGEWICLTNNGWWTSDLNHPASKMIGDLVEHHQSLNWVVVAPETGPHHFK